MSEQLLKDAKKWQQLVEFVKNIENIDRTKIGGFPYKKDKVIYEKLKEMMKSD